MYNIYIHDIYISIYNLYIYMCVYILHRMYIDTYIKICPVYLYIGCKSMYYIIRHTHKYYIYRCICTYKNKCNI